jgi:hypothetical protein
MPKRRRPVSPLSLPLPSQFPVPGPFLTTPPTTVAPAPYGDHGYVAALDHSGTCRACGKEGWIDRHPNRFPRCGACGVIQFYMGKFYDAPCVTPNGRTDGHGSYTKNHHRNKDGLYVGVCAFCDRDSDEPLPEWPELNEEDLEFESFSVDRGKVGPLKIGVGVTHKPSGLKSMCNVEASLLKNKAKALKGLREQLKRVGRGAYNPEE